MSEPLPGPAESRMTAVDPDYGTCERTCAQLRIYSGSMPPAEVTRILGISPTGTVTFGEVSPPNSLGRTRTGKVNGWFLSSEQAVASRDLRNHLDWLVAMVSPAQLGLQTPQDTPGVKMYVACVWWSKEGGGGPTLWPEQMSGLARLNLECSFDFQYYGEDDPQVTAHSDIKR
jgi:hypothetical protein